MPPDNIEIEKARKIVSELIFKVLTQVISVQKALSSFPLDTKDPSIDCAWHALVHFEADEDLRATDIVFSQEQDDYLEMIAFSLQKGEALPLNIIKEYNEFYDRASTPKTQNFINKLKNIFRFTI